LEREEYYLRSLKPTYNILQSAGSSLGYKHLDITKAKLSTKFKGENNHMFGKKHTQESIAKMGTAIVVTDVKIGLEKTFNSLRHAAEFLEVSYETVRKYKKTKKLLKGRYKIS
jgi:hypothetical protein